MGKSVIIPLEGLELPRMEGIVLPEMDSIKLTRYIFKNGLYEVYLNQGVWQYFNSEEETLEFLQNLSEKINQIYRFLNWAYIRTVSETQPFYFKLSPIERRDYDQTKSCIDQQFNLSLREFVNDNFHYFKKGNYIAEKLLHLQKIVSGSGFLNHVAPLEKTSKKIQEIANILNFKEGGPGGYIG